MYSNTELNDSFQGLHQEVKSSSNSSFSLDSHVLTHEEGTTRKCFLLLIELSAKMIARGYLERKSSN